MGFLKKTAGTPRLTQEYSKGRQVWVATCPHARCKQQYEDVNKAKATKACNTHISSKHKENPVREDLKKGNCPGCHKPEHKCKGTKPACSKRSVKKDKAYAKPHPQRFATHTPKGMQTNDGAKIKPGQNLNGIIYDEHGRRVWDVRKALGQDE